MEINADTPADQIIDAVPAARSIFRNYGLDPDSISGMTLGQAAARAHKDLQPLLLSLQRTYGLTHNHRSFPDEWVAGTPEEMTRILEEIYHSALAKLLPDFGKRLANLLRTRGDDYPELYDVGRLFERFRRRVEEHSRKEVSVIFPVIASGSTGRESEMRVAVDDLKEDHKGITTLMRDIRNLTLDYPLRRSDDAQVSALYDTWREADSVISRAMFLEENWLLPLAGEDDS